MWLDQKLLRQMVGSRLRDEQKAWLRRHKIPYTERKKGQLNVLVEAVRIRHLPSEPVVSGAQPNFEIFE